MATTDPFAKVRKQAQQALDAVLKEIRRREVELQSLIEQAERWRAALSGTTAPPTRTKPVRRKKNSSKRASSKRSPAGKRVNWDAVVNGLPKTFTIDDVMKRPGVKARGRAQVYPALTRWTDSKKVKRIAKGKYQKI